MFTLPSDKTAEISFKVGIAGTQSSPTSVTVVLERDRTQLSYSATKNSNGEYVANIESPGRIFGTGELKASINVLLNSRLFTPYRTTANVIAEIDTACTSTEKEHIGTDAPGTPSSSTGSSDGDTVNDLQPHSAFEDVANEESQVEESQVEESALSPELTVAASTPAVSDADAITESPPAVGISLEETVAAIASIEPQIEQKPLSPSILKTLEKPRETSVEMITSRKMANEGKVIKPPVIKTNVNYRKSHKPTTPTVAVSLPDAGLSIAPEITETQKLPKPQTSILSSIEKPQPERKRVVEAQPIVKPFDTPDIVIFNLKKTEVIYK